MSYNLFAFDKLGESKYEIPNTQNTSLFFPLKSINHFHQVRFHKIDDRRE